MSVSIFLNSKSFFLFTKFFVFFIQKLFTTENNLRAYKALIAAKYSGKSVNTQNVDKDKSNTQFNKIPTLEVTGGSLFDSSAIAYYLANAQLRGENELAQAQVLQWICFADNDILPAAFAWILPATGLSNQKQVRCYCLFSLIMMINHDFRL